MGTAASTDHTHHEQTVYHVEPAKTHHSYDHHQDNSVETTKVTTSNADHHNADHHVASNVGIRRSSSVITMNRHSSDLVVAPEDLDSMVFGVLDKLNLAFVWSDKLLVGVEKIDEQHRKLVKLINEVNQADRQGCERWVTGYTLSELIAYTDYHFRYEENLMAKYKWSNAAAHKLIHKAFVDKVLRLQARFANSDREDFGQDLLSFLTDWLQNHILKNDKEMCGYFAEQMEKEKRGELHLDPVDETEEEAAARTAHIDVAKFPVDGASFDTKSAQGSARLNKIVVLFNELLDAVHESKGLAGFVFEELAAFIEYHYRATRREMRVKEYAEDSKVQEFKTDHMAFINTVQKMYQEEAVSFDLLTFVRGWLSIHMEKFKVICSSMY